MSHIYAGKILGRGSCFASSGVSLWSNYHHDSRNGGSMTTCYCVDRCSAADGSLLLHSKRSS